MKIKTLFFTLLLLFSIKIYGQQKDFCPDYKLLCKGEIPTAGIGYAANNPNYCYKWSPSGLLQNATVPNPVLTDALTEKTTFTVKVTTPDGELFEDQITIFVYSLDLEIYLPQIDGGAAVAEADEESIGSQTFINIDNDDKDAIPDLNDNEVVGGDNELVKLRAKITFYPDILPAFQTPTNDRGAYNVNFALHLNPIAGADNIKLWKWDYKKDKSDFVINKADLIGGGSVFFVDRYLEGIKGNDATRGTKIRLELENQNTVFSPTCGADIVALTVVEILAVKWLGMGNGALSDEAGTKSPDFTGDYLDADTEYGATNSVRVFPDGRIEGGGVSASKNKVRIKIEMTPTAALPTKLYLRAFDMDDPSQNKKDTGMINRPEGGRLILDPNDDGISGTYEGGGGQTYDLHNDNRGLVNTRKYGYVNGMDSKGIFKVNISSKDVTINDFIVSEFAGDNYALFAASDSTHLLNFENKDSSDLDKIYDTSKGRTLPIDKGVKSNILTVWRLLHLEYDSMRNFAWGVNNSGNYQTQGNISSLFDPDLGQGYSLQATFGDINFSRAGLMDFDIDPSLFYTNLVLAREGRGRFENGNMIFNGNIIAAPAGLTSPILGHDENNIIFDGASGSNIIPGATIISSTNPAGGITNVTLTSIAESPKNTFFWITNPPLSAANIGDNLQYGGNITNFLNIPLGAAVTTNTLNLNYIFHDDDSNTLLPKNTGDIDSLVKIMKQIFIQPIIDGGGGTNDNNVPFSANFNVGYNVLAGTPKYNKLQQIILGIDSFNFTKNNKKTNFWTCHILSAFQGDFEKDHDPRLENITIDGQGLPISGATVLSHRNIAKGCYSSLIFLETIRDIGQPNKINLNIAHELGHQFGLSHGDTSLIGAAIPEYDKKNKKRMGIMTGLDYSGFFIPRHKNLIRSRVNSPGQN